MTQHNPKKYLVGSDVEQLSRLDYVTGIQRVVIESHKFLFKELNNFGFSIQGFMSRDEVRLMEYRKSKYYMSDPVINGEVVDLASLDLVLLLDLNWGFSFPALLKERQKRKLPVISVVYDFLPINFPDWFPVENAKTAFRVYLQKLIAVSDHIVFNSKKVQDDFHSLNWKFQGQTHVIPLGAFDVPSKIPHYLSPPKSIITVSTIEPRKGHREIIDAFDILRERGENFNLFIVGRYGWDSEELVERILTHPEYGGRLRWFPKLDDTEVSSLYDGSTVAVVASFDEGFGLSIEEALAHSLKVVARDIPVFREREQPNLTFFQNGAENLANAIMEAEENNWNAETAKTLRTMDDFSMELCNLITSQL